MSTPRSYPTHLGTPRSVWSAVIRWRAIVTAGHVHLSRARRERVMETASTASFAAVLRRHRVAAGLSQEALAARAGLSVRAVSDLERGSRRAPYRETVSLLADALGLEDGDRAALEEAVERGRGPLRGLHKLP